MKLRYRDPIIEELHEAFHTNVDDLLENLRQLTEDSPQSKTLMVTTLIEGMMRNVESMSTRIDELHEKNSPKACIAAHTYEGCRCRFTREVYGRIQEKASYLPDVVMILVGKETGHPKA